VDDCLDTLQANIGAHEGDSDPVRMEVRNGDINSGGVVEPKQSFRVRIVHESGSRTIV
jgi:hypothetical protein